MKLTIQMKTNEEHFPVVLFIKLHRVILTFEPVVLFIQYVVLNFESVLEILRCDHSNETSSAALSHGTQFCT